MRTLLQDNATSHHCSGSDTLLGSANVSASIFILLLLGFVGGVCMTSVFVWFKQKKQRRIDLEYRDRNKSKAMGDIPDVEDLIKSARFVTESDDGVHINLSEDAIKDSLNLSGEPISTAPGPLQGGSQRCLHMSIEGSHALLRWRRETLSQAEEVNPQNDAFHSRSISNVTDPESPLPRRMIPTSDGKTGDLQLLNMSDSPKHEKIQAKKIGRGIFFEHGARLDGTASCILENNPKKSSSFAPPFQSAWKRMSMDTNIPVTLRKSSDSTRSSISDIKGVSQDQEKFEDLEIPSTAVNKNPFATTESAIKEAEDAINQMS